LFNTFFFNDYIIPLPLTHKETYSVWRYSNKALA
jgi:hypothetical protein